MLVGDIVWWLCVPCTRIFLNGIHVCTVNTFVFYYLNPSDAHAHEEYEVEQILGERVAHNKVEYLIQWKGYTQCTWEPEDHLHCPILLKKYRVSLPSQC